MSTRIPIHGSMSRPLNPNEGLEELIMNKIEWKYGDLLVEVSTEEFTSVCPTTGQPDFNTITIVYKPKQYYLESKSIKFYLWSFREYGAHCEKLSMIIAEDIKKAIDAKYIQVIVNQFPRGGLKIISKYTIGE